MKLPEYVLIIALAVMNLAAGFGCAVPIAKGFAEINDRPRRFFRYYAMLIGIYFAECVAFPMGMATQVFSVSLAFVWGVIFGLWLRGRKSARKVLKQVLFLSIYTCLPTASFCIVVPIVTWFDGWHILNAEEGMRFGMPDFLPWPLNTILGFCSALAIGTVVLKIAITTGLVYLFIREKPGGK